MRDIRIAAAQFEGRDGDKVALCLVESLNCSLDLSDSIPDFFGEGSQVFKHQLVL